MIFLYFKVKLKAPVYFQSHEHSRILRAVKYLSKSSSYATPCQQAAQVEVEVKEACDCHRKEGEFFVYLTNSEFRCATPTAEEVEKELKTKSEETQKTKFTLRREAELKHNEPHETSFCPESSTSYVLYWGLTPDHFLPFGDFKNGFSTSQDGGQPYM